MNGNSFYWICGKNAVMEAVRNNKRVIKKIYCADENLISQIKKIKPNIKIFSQKIGKDIIKSMHELAHQNIFAEIKKIAPFSEKDFENISRSNNIVILDGISDLRNFSNIIRSALAFGIDYIFIKKGSVNYFNAVTHKVSSGAIENIKIVEVKNLSNTINFFKKKNFWVYGLDLKSKKIIDHDFIFEKKRLIIFGSEGKGMKDLTRKNCDFLIKIPLNSKVESLNLSNTAAIIFYKLN